MGTLLPMQPMGTACWVGLFVPSAQLMWASFSVPGQPALWLPLVWKPFLHLGRTGQGMVLCGALHSGGDGQGWPAVVMAVPGERRPACCFLHASEVCSGHQVS
jgi:hypothetical protein